MNMYLALTADVADDTNGLCPASFPGTPGTFLAPVDALLLLADEVTASAC